MCRSGLLQEPWPRRLKTGRKERCHWCLRGKGAAWKSATVGHEIGLKLTEKRREHTEVRRKEREGGETLEKESVNENSYCVKSLERAWKSPQSSVGSLSSSAEPIIASDVCLFKASQELLWGLCSPPDADGTWVRRDELSLALLTFAAAVALNSLHSAPCVSFHDVSLVQTSISSSRSGQKWPGWVFIFYLFAINSFHHSVFKEFLN